MFDLSKTEIYNLNHQQVLCLISVAPPATLTREAVSMTADRMLLFVGFNCNQPENSLDNIWDIKQEEVYFGHICSTDSLSSSSVLSVFVGLLDPLSFHWTSSPSASCYQAKTLSVFFWSYFFTLIWFMDLQEGLHSVHSSAWFMRLLLDVTADSLGLNKSSVSAWLNMRP